MKYPMRLAVFFAVGILLTALLVWTAIPVVLAGSVHGLARALFWPIYVTASFLLYIYLRYRDPSCGYYMLAFLLLCIPLVGIQFFFDIFIVFNSADTILNVVSTLETVLILWFAYPWLEARFPEKKSIPELITEQSQGGDLS